MQRKPALGLERRAREPRSETLLGQHFGRTLSARRYIELARQPRLSDLPARPPPYLAGAMTAAVFLFLAYLILGGA
jgi:hypothetical protein